jgi:biotin carboxyl carrier protein
MKKLRITVRGISYEVLVEVLEDSDSAALAETSARGGSLPGGRAPITSQPPAQAAAPSPPAGPTAPAFPRAPGDPNTVAAPIAGTVQKVFVAPDQEVEAKVPLVLLDAMKMDTYIYAPRHGRIAEVAVAPGDSVTIGQPLVRYAPEA